VHERVRRRDVERERPLEAVASVLEPVERASCVVDEDVDVVRALADLAGEPRHVPQREEIGGEELRLPSSILRLLHHRVASRRVAPDDEHLVPLLRERERRGLAEPRCRPGDDRNLA